MTKSKTNPKVDGYLSESENWQEELKQLRNIVLGCGLTEELKWGQPCYTFEQKNLIILHRMKETCAIAFLKGALLKDPHGLLIQPGPNSQSGRWIKFTNARDIARLKTILKAYIHEAIEAEKAGLKVEFKRNPEPIPEELQNKLAHNPALKTAFKALTPGRQRGYILYFSAPKQSKTRESRIEKCMTRILSGKGMNDR
jgi:uncharacterized protein YdeI (YjbR/CyaY-like superfamily)